jgi:aspartokinase/homoserine dehydrogenase 1
MKVLKFGGSSVANSENIKKVLAIIAKESKNQKIAVVVSAFGKTTNALIEGANLASEKNEEYKDILKTIEKHHFEIINKLISTENKQEITRYIQQLFNHLETIYKGCFLLQEITPKTLATISSFGELFSSYIIANAANQSFKTDYKDSRELIIASDNYLNAAVNFTETTKNIQNYFD